MRKFVLTIMLLAMTAVVISAKPVERLVLKNGSVYHGWLKSQQPGKKVIFVTELAEVIIPEEEVVDEPTSETYTVSDLSKQWQAWAKENPTKVNKTQEGTTIKLFSFSTKDNGYVEKARILEKGDDWKYVICPDNEALEIAWNEIEAIEYDTLDPLVINGLTDEIKTRDGETITGTIIRKQIGDYYELIDNDGINYKIKVADVKTMSKVPLNADATIIQQAQLLDVVKCRKNSSPKEGVIVEQGKDYLMLSQPNRPSPLKINVSEITSIDRKINPEYIEDKAVVIESDTTILVNGNPVTSFAVSKATEQMLFAIDAKPIVININENEAMGKVVIEMKDGPLNKVAYMGTAEHAKVIKNDRKQRPEKQRWAFSFEKLMITNKVPVSERVIKDVIRRDYSLAKGYYAFYINHKAYLIQVK